MEQDKNQSIKVAVRCRPMSSRQKQRMFENIVQVKQERGQIIVRNTKEQNERQRVFSFDIVFGQKNSQEHVFKQAALPIIQSVLEGFNGTIFAYGQTGTGKTHTMQGSKTDQTQRGIIHRTFQHIMKSIQETFGLNFMVRVSMIELYNEEIIDLLSSNRKNKLQLHESKDKGVYIKDLTQYTVTSVDDMKNKLKKGSQFRQVGQTQMSCVSSRSHSLFIIKVQQQDVIQGQSKIKAGKLNLVDLAGSQRQKKTQATGIRLVQGIFINISLLTLGQVIGALTNPNISHIPYRDSKLTRLLQQSLGGNSKTVMIANIGPASYNYEQTISTLRYANQTKKIKNKPKINEDPKDAMIRQYQQQIQKLKKILEGQLIPDAIAVQKRVKAKRNQLQDVRMKFQIQKKNILSQKDLKEKKSLQKKQKQIAQQNEYERIKQEQLAIKLIQMKKKVLHGNKLKQQAIKHQKQLFDVNRQLEQRQQVQKKIMNDIENLIKAEQKAINKNLSLKELIQHRRNQQKILNSKLLLAYDQNNDIQEVMIQQKEQLQEQNRIIFKEIKLVNLLLKNFVSIEEIDEIKSRLKFDEQIDDWILQQETLIPKKNPGSVIKLKYPICRHSRFAVVCGDQNPRFRQQNLIQMDIDRMKTLVQDFKPSKKISQNVIEGLNLILNQTSEQKNFATEYQNPNVYILNSLKIDKEEIMRQRQENIRAKSAKKLRKTKKVFN